ncbi:MAG: succinyldiaminopimelate transaminase [Ectothiorhodospiraceae bacterium]|nr:succinyldiaminopimelate transaminase [Ectothiorhodospiraceae bacterium]MCH8504529.1 succinyldiaminopimelate transaminase [Ectothiorhodospiraceae bacterium]
MNSNLDRLQPYPFQRLGDLLADSKPPRNLPLIDLGIGEPKHPTPVLLRDALVAHLDGLGSYPPTKGGAPLRQTICNWLEQRFVVPAGWLDPERHCIPVAGTREALFAVAQAVVDSVGTPVVAMPNPFYQIYEGAALLAGAEPYFLNCTADNDYTPDLDQVPDSVWDCCQLIYVCSPGNPSGAVLERDWYGKLLALADRHDFIIAADECYSEIYRPGGEPPLGLLQYCAETGRHDFRRCLVFHSLSKRSNAPGLRSGFVAGDAEVLRRFLLFRTYHGCALSDPVQAASIAAWSDETHVEENRVAYQEKFDAVLDILQPVMDVQRPAAGFYLWPRTPIADTIFARRLYEQENVRVLPGSYLSRKTQSLNPGADHVRLALVAPLDQCVEAARRIRRLLERSRKAQA